MTSPVKSGRIVSFLPLQTTPTPSPQRLQALYSDFSRQKSSNPSAYTANVDWWKRALPEVILANRTLPDKLVLSVDDSLIDELRTESGTRPSALGTVILEMLESSALYPLSGFLSSPYSVYYSGSIPWRIATMLVGRPLWWLMGQLNLFGDPLAGGESIASRWNRAKGKYVLRTNVEKAADAILDFQRSQKHVSLADSLHSVGSFREEFAGRAFPGFTLSDLDIKVLLKYLERDRKVIVTEKEVIKFLNEDEMESAMVTEVDHGVLEMKITIQCLHDQISEIERRISECTDKVKGLLSKKQQEAAKSYLRSRKLLEDVMAKRMASLETVQGMLLKIENAAGDIEIMKAYETSTLTLRKLLAHPSLQRENVDATMESMSDALADHAEIEEAVKLGGQGARAAAGVEEVDEKELEAELEALVKEKQEEEKLGRERVEKERIEEEARRKHAADKAAAERLKAEADARVREEEKQKAESGIPQKAALHDQDQLWRERWEANQREKAAQAERDKQEDVRLRARWADEDARRAAERAKELAD